MATVKTLDHDIAERARKFVASCVPSSRQTRELDPEELRALGLPVHKRDAR